MTVTAEKNVAIPASGNVTVTVQEICDCIRNTVHDYNYMCDCNYTRNH